MNVSKIIFIGAALLSVFPFVDTPFALLLGIILAQTIKHPFHNASKKITHILLQVSVIGLGFGMNAMQALEAGINIYRFFHFKHTNFGFVHRQAPKGREQYLVPDFDRNRSLWWKRNSSHFVDHKIERKADFNSVGHRFYPEFGCTIPVSLYRASFASLATSVWRMGSNRHTRHQFGCRSRLPVAQFTAEGGYFLNVLSDPSKTFFLSLGGSAVAGYETVNWGDKLLFDGSTLENRDRFVYGGAITLEMETYLTDRVVLLLTGRERILSGSDITKFHTQFGVGLKFIIN